MTAAEEQLEGVRASGAASVLDGALADDEARAPVIFFVTQGRRRADGGVESITQVLARLRRVRPLVVTQSETDFNRRWREAGARVSVWPMPALAPGALFMNNLRAFRLVRSEGCRVVHCNDIYALWNSALGARAAGAAVVFNVRNVKAEGRAYGRRWRLALRLATRMLVLSEEMGDALARRLGVEASRVERVYSAVDLEKFSPAASKERAALRGRLGIEKDAFAVGVVAAFDPRKGQLEFIKESAPRLARSVPNARVYFVGDFDPAREEYARLCLEASKAAGLEGKVSFVGFTPDAPPWYRALDAVAVCSRNEGLARCMIESLACATPVVSFEVCSAREILESRGCGVVVRGGDFGALADALARLASEPGERARLGANGAGAARSLFDPAEVVRAYERVYLSLAGS